MGGCWSGSGKGWRIAEWKSSYFMSFPELVDREVEGEQPLVWVLHDVIRFYMQDQLNDCLQTHTDLLKVIIGYHYSLGPRYRERAPRPSRPDLPEVTSDGLIYSTSMILGDDFDGWYGLDSLTWLGLSCSGLFCLY